MDELFEKMRDLISSKLDIDKEKITMDSSFRTDLLADSLDIFELAYAIEEEMGVFVPEEKVTEFETVRDAYNFLKAQKK